MDTIVEIFMRVETLQDWRGKHVLCLEEGFEISRPGACSRAIQLLQPLPMAGTLGQRC